MTDRASITRREVLGLLAAGAAGTAVSGAGVSACGSSTRRADLVLYGADVFTVDASSRRAEAVAIAGNEILAVGSNEDVRQHESSTTRAVDLDRHTILPGINDSHLHALGWGMSQPPLSIDVGYPAVRSIADIVSSVRSAVGQRAPGDWVMGRGWDQPYLAEGRAPTRQDLDAVSPTNPVVLTEFSGHALWVNSAALEAAGIDRDSVAPSQGEVVKDPSGEPTGVLLEGAMALVWGAVPPMTDELRRQALLAATDRMVASGITSFTEPGIDLETFALYAELARSGELPVRTTVLLRPGNSLDSLASFLEPEIALEGIDSHRLRFAGIKLFADGIPTGNKTAWLREPYEGGGNGALMFSGETEQAQIAELRAMVGAIHDAGLQIGTHATGDRAIDEVVAAYVDAQTARPRAAKSPRHYLIHADLARPETLETMAAHGIGANFNASIKYLIADGQNKSLGATRSAYEWPYRTALDAGVVVASSSDAPVTDGVWQQGVATAVLREGKQSGQVSGREQSISLDEALRTYTWAGAWQDHAEQEKGSLEVGKLADLCVLDARLSEVDLHELTAVRCVMTVLDGEVVYDRLGS